MNVYTKKVMHGLRQPSSLKLSFLKLSSLKNIIYNIK